MPDLLPCPFCGPEHIEEVGKDMDVYYCNRCGCRAFRTAWQSRPVEDALRRERDEARAKVTELEKPDHGQHQCATCVHEFATCNPTKIVWGLDLNPNATGAETDRVIWCSLYHTKVAELEALEQCHAALQRELEAVPKTPDEAVLWPGNIGTVAMLRAQVAEMERERDDAVAALGQVPCVPPSVVCAKYHWQNCHACDNAACGDNTTPSIVALRDAQEQQEVVE